MLAYGAQYPSEYDLMVLSGPAIAAHTGVSKPKALLGKLVGSVLPDLPIEQIDPDAVSRDPAVVADYKADPLVYRGKIPAGIGKALLMVSEAMPGLAAKITGWKINILSETEYREQKKLEDQLKIDVKELPGVGKKLQESLNTHGIETVQQLAKCSVEELTEIEGVGSKRATSLIEKAKEYLSPSKAEG